MSVYFRLVGEYSYQHVVKDVIEKSHVEDKVFALVEEILVRRDVVADDVVSFPSTEKGESGSNLKLNGVVHHTESRGGNIADVVSVVSISGYN